MLFPWYIKYPNQNDEILNLDWILSTIDNLVIEVANFVSLNTIKYADPIQWNITTQYEKNTVVIDPISGSAYISTKPVPAGVGLNDTDYWNIIFTLDVISANKNITLRDDANNMLATFESVVDDWLLWQGTLYIVTRDIDIGQAYVVDYNIKRFTVEAFLKSYISNLKNYFENIIGSLEDLETSATTDIVAAINSVLTDTSTLIGSLSDLETTDKDSIVDAINELVSSLSDLTDAIGDLDDLETTDKSNIVAAINEVLDASDDIEHFKVIDVTKHGVVADGVTDCTSKVQSLISAGAFIYFPKGTYYFASPVNVNVSDVTITGDGLATVLLLKGNGFTFSQFRCTLENLKISCKGNNSFGVHVTGSYCTFSHLMVQDYSTNVVNSFLLGEAGQGCWYNIFNDILINDINNTTRNGIGFKCYSTVNNVFNDIIIHGKHEGLWFDSDKTVGYSTDGAQLENINITTCDRAFYINDCTAIYIDNTIMDQLTDYGLTITKGGNINLTECYISAGGNSTNAYQAIQVTDVESVKIDNCQIAGTPSTFGIIIRNSKNINVLNSVLGHFTQGITFADATSVDCHIDNCYFNELITTKLYLAGSKNSYSNLRGTGAITVAGGYQTTGTLYYGTHVHTQSSATYSAIIDIPLPGDLKQPVAPIIIPVNVDALYTWSYDLANSPSGYVRITLKRADNLPFNGTFTIGFMFPFDFTA